MRKFLAVILVVLLALSVLSLVAGPAGALDSRVNPQCNNGVDDDGDGLVDLNDPGCSRRADNTELDRPAGDV